MLIRLKALLTWKWCTSMLWKFGDNEVLCKPWWCGSKWMLIALEDSLCIVQFFGNPAGKSDHSVWRLTSPSQSGLAEFSSATFLEMRVTWSTKCYVCTHLITITLFTKVIVVCVLLINFHVKCRQILIHLLEARRPASFLFSPVLFLSSFSYLSMLSVIS